MTHPRNASSKHTHVPRAVPTSPNTQDAAAQPPSGTHLQQNPDAPGHDRGGSAPSLPLSFKEREPSPPSNPLHTRPVRRVLLPCACGTLHEMPDPGRLVRFRCNMSGTELEYRPHHAEGHALIGAEGAIPLRGDSLRLGRDPASEIPVPHGQLSRNHCRFVLRDGAYWLEDLGSTHGTHVNESPLCGGTPLRLVAGDLIRIADLYFRYVTPFPVVDASKAVPTAMGCHLEGETWISPEPGSEGSRAAWTENATVTGGGIGMCVADEVVDELLGKDLGAFHVRSVLDQGGMGRVYRGTEKATGRECAVKTMIPDRIPTPDLVDRFRREIELSARLSHPNIIAFFGMGQYGDILYFASEFFESRDLQSWYEDDPAPFADVLRIGIQTCCALQEAHEHGVIHRDIKPSNILRNANGLVKVIDFGIAKMLDDPAYSALTMSGTAIGTPKYMAPEQMRAQRHRIGPPSDVYALAATLYFCLTTHPPRKGGSIMEIFLTISDPPASISAIRPDVPPEMDAVFCRALAPEPEDRYPDMTALRRALESLLPA